VTLFARWASGRTASGKFGDSGRLGAATDRRPKAPLPGFGRYAAPQRPSLKLANRSTGKHGRRDDIQPTKDVNKPGEGRWPASLYISARRSCISPFPKRTKRHHLA